MAKSAIVIDCDGGGSTEKVREALCESGFVISNDSRSKEALDEAEYLVLIASDAQQLSEKDVESQWEYFLDEVKWKRKESGEVIIVDTSEISFSPSRLAYALKKCKRFRIDRLFEMTDYMSGKPSAVQHDAPVFVPEPPKPADVPEKRDSGACKEDHIFGDDTGYKIYVRDDENGVCKDDHVFEDDGYKVGLRKEKQKTAVTEEENKYEYRKGKPYESPFEGHPDEEPKKRTQPRNNKLVAVIITVVMFIIFLSMAARICSSIFDGFMQVEIIPSQNSVLNGLTAFSEFFGLLYR